jgi:hypothetical protein
VGTTFGCPATDNAAIVQAKGVVGKPRQPVGSTGAERTSSGLQQTQVLPRKVQVLLFAVTYTAHVGAVRRWCAYRRRAVLAVVMTLFHRDQDLVERQRRERRGVAGYSVGDNELPAMRQASA